MHVYFNNFIKTFYFVDSRRYSFCYHFAFYHGKLIDGKQSTYNQPINQSINQLINWSINQFWFALPSA